MKKIYCAAAVALLAAACQNKAEIPAPEAGTREITVSSILPTKTSIDYEGDISHLVWSEGDNVMYLTGNAEGLEDYGFMKASVADNRFTATIPGSATNSDKMLVVWPSRETALGNSEAVVNLTDEAEVNSTDAFDGRTLPMVAFFNVPDDNVVDAAYRPLGAVLRVALDTLGHSAEKLLSIRLSTAEKCTGSYLVSTTEPDGAEFRGNGNTVTVKFSDTPPVADFGYAYLVVNKAAYTGVKLEVETDADTYVFADGSMDLTAQDRGLYRISLTLPVSEKPQIPVYRKVTDNAQLTDGQYLILCRKDDSSFYTPQRKSNDFLSSATVSCLPDGTIEDNDEVRKHAITLRTGAGHEGLFALKMESLGTYCWLQSPLNVSQNVDYVGYFWYEKESNLSDDGCWWNIDVSGEYAQITHGIMNDRTGAVTFFVDGNKFGVRAPETDPDGYREIELFKLN